jgi:quercetin dioxygenase-like cupin family protein
MKTKTKLIIGTAAAAVVGIALATPIVNLASPLLSSGNSERPFDVTGFFPVENGYFKVALTTNRPSTIATQIAAFSAGGENGWHSHAGMVIVTVVSGTIDWYDENCKKTTYTAGQSWMEGSQVHSFKNVGPGTANLTATFIVSQGEPLRIDQPAPRCAAELGLN